MHWIWHNKWPELWFEVRKINEDSVLWKEIYSYIKRVSDWAFQVIVPTFYILRWDDKLFQIKPDAYMLFDSDESGENFKIRWIEECIPLWEYKQAA